MMEHCQAYGVLGFPLGHSLSPYLHNMAFRKLGIPGCYFKWEIAPGDLEQFMSSFRLLSLSGLSVTIPHKESIMDMLDQVSFEAGEIGAVNTVYRHKDLVVGTNTDYAGFLGPIQSLDLSSALVLGAGGASRAVIYGLKKMGCSKIIISNRTEMKAWKMAEEFGIEHAPWSRKGQCRADLLVNTTPLGTAGAGGPQNPWDQDELPFQVVYDLVYNPLETPLLKAARQNRLTTVSGLGMFVHQALEQFRIWTGQSFDPNWAEDLLGSRLTGQ
ncbi:MAG: shikimate dehydrogenase [Desulfonatronovibrionaceae bacterium]